MNNNRRLELARQHILVLKRIDALRQLYKDENWALDDIRNENIKEQAEEGLQHLDDLIDLLDEAADKFEEVAQGDYVKILAKEQRRQAQMQKDQTATKQQAQLQEAAKKIEFTQKEIEAFLKVCPNPDNPEGYDIESLDEFWYWKWQDTGQCNRYDDVIFEHTEAYKQFLKEQL